MPGYISSFAKLLLYYVFNYCDRWRETWPRLYCYLCICCDFARIWSGKCNHNVAVCPIYRLREEFQFFFIALLILQSRISASNYLIHQCRSGIILTKNNIFALSVNCSVLSLEQNVNHNIHLCCDFYINSSCNNFHAEFVDTSKRTGTKGRRLFTHKIAVYGEKCFGLQMCTTIRSTVVLAPEIIGLFSTV